MSKKSTAKANSNRRRRVPVDDLKALARMGDSDVDTSDIPEILDWTGVKRGLFYRPIKQQLTLRLDADVIAWFKHRAKDGGYQTQINRALRAHVQAHGRKSG
ncbi:MAG: BrnA antitoxin family protein [Alphaproteobacteria bacterium]|nr:BrnA antitoxin family protein [Alphaproteobacteria bacterium]